LLDLPVDVGLARRHADPDSINRLDGESLAFHRRVREVYLAAANANPGSWMIVNAERPQAKIAAELLQAVRERLT